MEPMSKLLKIIFFCFLLFNNINALNASENKRVLLFVNNPNAVGCYEKKISNKCFKLQLGKFLLPSREQIKEKSWETKKWLKMRKSAAIRSTWWLSSEYVVPSNALKKINKDWKIKEFVYDSGDSRVSYYFKKDGSVVYKYSSHRGNKEYKGNVFIDPNNKPNIIQIRYPSPSYEKNAGLYGFNNKTNTIIVETACVPGELCKQLKF